MLGAALLAHEPSPRTFTHPFVLPHPPTQPSSGREEIEDLANAAVKEEGIEAKLAGVVEQWAQEAFTFADHKARGAVVLKVRFAGCWLLGKG